MSLERDGYEVLVLSRKAREIVQFARCVVLAIYDPLRHSETQYQAQKALSRMPSQVIEADEAIRMRLPEGEIALQRAPYLRIVRPMEGKDNIGFHRDTWYGSKAGELNVWLPLANTTEASALRVRRYSHLDPVNDDEWERTESSVIRGSMHHQLGFLYAPKRLKRAVTMHALPVSVGEVIVFHPHLLHGQEVNGGDLRISMDFRVVPAQVADERFTVLKEAA